MQFYFAFISLFISIQLNNKVQTTLILMSNGFGATNAPETKWEDTIHWEENDGESVGHKSMESGSSEIGGITTTYISKILNRLTNRTSYDKRLRPLYGEGAVDVGISIHITQISSVSEVEMDFTLDFYLRQTWYDPRLAFAQIDPELAKRVKKLTVGIEYLERLWKPDTFFPNEKNSIFHVATVENAFLRIEPDGRIYTSQRMTVKAMCPMDLSLFPMDSQTCKLGLESYGYDVDDIGYVKLPFADYYWGYRRLDGKKPEEAVAFDEFSLPQFRRTGYRVTGTHVRTASGEYARLYIEVILTRNVGFYLMNMVIPAMLIVSISWVSFWLSREASPARVGLGYLTVLTMTTLITTTNNSLPKVSYIKWLDVFLNFCFIMVFASLVEYAVVSYWHKRNRHKRARPIRSSTICDPTNTVGIRMTALMEEGVPSPQSSYTPFPTFLPECTCSPNPPSATPSEQLIYQKRRSTIGHMPFSSASFIGDDNNFASTAENHPQMGLSNMASRRKFKRRQRGYSYYAEMGLGVGSNYLRGFGQKFFMGGSPSKIDQFSRCCFPILFIIFNIIYWSALTFMSKKDLEKAEFVPFD